MTRVMALMSDAWGGYGGIQQFNRDFCDALAERAVTVLVRRGPNVTHGNRTQVRPRFGKAGYALRVYREAKGLQDDSIIFCGHLRLLPLAILARKISGRPVWLQLHGIEAWPIPSRLVRRLVIQCDLVTAVSRYTRRRFLRWANIPPERVKVLPNSPRDIFTPGSADAHVLGALGLAADQFLLSVARLDRTESNKGLEMLLHAYADIHARHPEVRLVIAGDGNARADIQALAGRLSLQDSVVFPGRVTDQELVSLYRGARLFAMPSVKEGFGIVFLEALACGCPVLGFDRDGSVDPLRDGAGGLLSSPKSLAGDIAAVLEGEVVVSPDGSWFTRDKFFRHVAALLQDPHLQAGH